MRSVVPVRFASPVFVYGRRYLLHATHHTSASTPTTINAQAREDRQIAAGLAGRPTTCWAVPQPFVGDPGRPLTRRQLRALARVPDGFQGPVNGPGSGMHDDHEM